jgi:hypothetical protein
MYAQIPAERHYVSFSELPADVKAAYDKELTRIRNGG